MTGDKVREIDIDSDEIHRYKNQYTGCLILTKDNYLILQQRGEDWDHYPGYLCEFGGHIEAGETPLDAIIRELHEELGARVLTKDLVLLGAITESDSNHEELIYTYFWHDRENTLTGCYEGEAKLFESADDVLAHDRVTQGLRWMIAQCRLKKLIT